jgi:hypothetical protein
MRTFTGMVVLSVLGVVPAIAQERPPVQSEGPDRKLSLTVYNNDLALIEHIRPGNVPQGTQRIEFKGVSAKIIPQTVSVAAPGLELIEQNFDYDLLTPSKLMEKAVGQTVRIIRTNPGTGAETAETAEVLSTAGGAVLRIGQRIEVLREDGIPARVIFDKVPENLRATPTLSVLANMAQPLRSDIRLAYLSRGLSWASDYVAVFDEAASEASLQGWITLTNQTGTSFANAQVQLVAGDINTVSNEAQWWQRYNRQRQPQTAVRGGGTESTARPRLADYYVYPIAEPTTVANNQNKQVSFLSADKVKASKVYEIVSYSLNSEEEPRSADVRIRLSNSRAAGLGEQLPSGIMRVYVRDARGQPQFVGEDRIGHTSAGSELSIKTGDAFDVTAQQTVIATKRQSARRTESSVRYVLRNARPEPVTVTLRQAELARFNRVNEESIKGRRVDADSFAWDVAVPANGETTLTFTVEQWW